MNAAVKRAGPRRRMQAALFQKRVYDHFEKHGRLLPWRKTRNPYHILVSEIMLQQTQVDSFVDKYLQFISLFPDIGTLARAPLREILRVWQGLGYNRRELALKQIAVTVVEQHKGKIPCSLDALVDLPGIGRNTASAIMALAFNLPVVFIETNIRSVFIAHLVLLPAGLSELGAQALVDESMPVRDQRGF